jgi:uncharacterized membrane protein YkvA (DUF1232 family)
MTSPLHSLPPTVDAAESSMEEQTGNSHSPDLAGMTWKQQAQRIHLEAQTFYFAFKHPRVQWYAKLVAVSTAGYLLSPIQLIPTFIPVIGLLDDFLVLFLGVKLLQRMIPVDVLLECREQAKAAEMQRKNAGRSMAAVIAFLSVAMVWLFAAITASRLIGVYIPSEVER